MFQTLPATAVLHQRVVSPCVSELHSTASGVLICSVHGACVALLPMAAAIV